MKEETFLIYFKSSRTTTYVVGFSVDHSVGNSQYCRELWKNCKIPIILNATLGRNHDYLQDDLCNKEEIFHSLMRINRLQISVHLCKIKRCRSIQGTRDIQRNIRNVRNLVCIYCNTYCGWNKSVPRCHFFFFQWTRTNICSLQINEPLEANVMQVNFLPIQFAHYISKAWSSFYFVQRWIHKIQLYTQRNILWHCYKIFLLHSETDSHHFHIKQPLKIFQIIAFMNEASYEFLTKGSTLYRLLRSLIDKDREKLAFLSTTELFSR